MRKNHQIINRLLLLPWTLEVSERARTVAGDGERWHAVKKVVVNRVEIDPDTHVR